MTARVLLLALLALALRLEAQNPTPSPQPGTTQSVLPIFRAQLPGGIYEVGVRSIVAVSIHEYIVDAAARVVEVNLDTNSSLFARFYFLEPNTPGPPSTVASGALAKAQELLTTTSDKAGVDVWRKVVKNYPVTTHAKTAEFRVQSREDLNKIFDAADEAFRFQRPKTVKIE
jgi:hypothetical protein